MRKNKMVRFATAGALVVGSLIPAGVAFAEYGDPDTGTEGTDPGNEETSGSESGGLPVTGGDIFVMTTIGGALAIGGTVLVRSGRRKSVVS